MASWFDRCTPFQFSRDVAPRVVGDVPGWLLLALHSCSYRYMSQQRECEPKLPRYQREDVKTFYFDLVLASDSTVRELGQELGRSQYPPTSR